MKPVKEAISSCRHCQFYHLEGRRGGYCQQLGVPVQGRWEACSLATAPFATSWQKLAGINAWQSENADSPSVVSPEVALQAIGLTEAESCSNTAAMLEEVFLHIE